MFVAKCQHCGRVTAFSMTQDVVKDWLDKGLWVAKRDFTNDDPKINNTCQFCNKQT